MKWHVHTWALLEQILSRLYFELLLCMDQWYLEQNSHLAFIRVLLWRPYCVLQISIIFHNTCYLSLDGGAFFCSSGKTTICIHSSSLHVIRYTNDRCHAMMQRRTRILCSFKVSLPIIVNLSVVIVHKPHRYSVDFDQHVGYLRHSYFPHCHIRKGIHFFKFVTKFSLLILLECVQLALANTNAIDVWNIQTRWFIYQ